MEIVRPTFREGLPLEDLTGLLGDPNAVYLGQALAKPERPPISADTEARSPVARAGHDQRAEAVVDRPVLPFAAVTGRSRRRRGKTDPRTQVACRVSENAFQGGANGSSGEPVPHCSA
ncbi:hypothetical protein [Streptomyces sp. NPDC017949]|uniref:hypothetical protein n=1 Tax=Streptomyces sp. NPDC017949 TaxID=3365020 RepID=UPI0037A713CA